MNSIGPIAVAGGSALFDDILEFGQNGLILRTDPEHAQLFAVTLHSFLARSAWTDESGAPSARHYLGQIPPVTIQRVRAGDANLLFDMSSEGCPFVEEAIGTLHASLSELGIDPTACTILQQNRLLEDDYHAWLKPRGMRAMRCEVYDRYPRRLACLLAQRTDFPDFNSSVRPKAFACLNWTPKPHRVGVVSWLLGQGYASDGFVSFNRYNKNAPESDTIGIPDWFPDPEGARKSLPLLEQGVFTVDRPVNDTESPDYVMGPDYIYQDSYFSVVTESNVFSGNMRFTEKSIKPMAMMQPFLIVGHARTLELLRDFGFETFGEMFDESYDEVDDTTERLDLVLKQIDRVLLQGQGALHQTVNQMLPKLSRNAAHARDGLPRMYRETLDPQLVARLAGFSLKRRAVNPD